jgi:hypothetical protein
VTTVSTPDLWTPAGWDAALAGAGSPPPLTQSWGYGAVQAREGWSVERVALAGGGLATVLLQGGGPLRWAYVPRGPVPATPAAVGQLADWARERRLARLRVEPEAPPEFAEAVRHLGFRPAADVQPRHTLIVPLGTEDEMIARCKPKHRYNIRLALKRGVTVAEGADAGELWRQTRGTEQIHGISLPGEAHYGNRLELLAWCRTYVASHEGRPLSASLVARYGGRAYYLFGGDNREQRQLMPNYAVQWVAMRAAADAGCRDYDLWGLPPASDPSHPWYGLWQFKTGFGGEMVSYCGAWDLVLSPLADRIDRAAGRALRAARRLVL